MVNKDRMISEFIEIASIDSVSLNEKAMATKLKEKLTTLGYEVFEDNAAKIAGGNSGNLICNIAGEKDVPTILLMSHMDTVSPGIGKKPRVDGDVICSDGSTVLGADDLAGVECILETLRLLKENNVSHGNIQVAFTIAEEIGLIGAKSLDYSKINAKFGFVVDSSGKIGTVAVTGPSQYVFDISIKGKAAHAGVEPEKGINAIQITSKAISNMKLGRIDEETTANVGMIEGGRATNIVCESVSIKAEARSLKKDKLESQKNHMYECFEEATKFFNGIMDFKSTLEYEAYNVKENKELIDILQEAANKTSIDLQLETTGGGSDTNIVNSKGIKAVNLGIGVQKLHSTEEFIKIDDMVKATEFLYNIINSVR